jgi:putative transposase
LAQITSGDERLRLQRLIFREIESWLDRAECVRHLHNAVVAEMVVEAIEHRAKQAVWRMFEFVVMPNHIHLFFELTGGRLKVTLEDFKEWTGRRAGTLIQLHGQRFWQKEWFDHWSRSDEEDDRIAAYIRQNPVKAGLVEDYRQFRYSSWATK